MKGIIYCSPLINPPHLSPEYCIISCLLELQGKSCGLQESWHSVRLEIIAWLSDSRATSQSARESLYSVLAARFEVARMP